LRMDRFWNGVDACRSTSRIIPILSRTLSREVAFSRTFSGCRQGMIRRNLAVPSSHKMPQSWALHCHGLDEIDTVVCAKATSATDTDLEKLIGSSYSLEANVLRSWAL
jgi:hypothetical protein